MNGDSDVDETDMDSSLDSMSGNPLVLLVGDFYERQKKSPLAFFFCSRVSRYLSAFASHSEIRAGENNWMHTMIR